MGRGQRVRAVETAPGWRDEAPDITTGEHDGMSAMLELAWHDLHINMESVPPVRHDEALAAKLSAHEWITSDEEHLMSFRSVCLHLGVQDVAHVRQTMLRGVRIPKAKMPEKWRLEFDWHPGQDRTGRRYVTQRQRQRMLLSEGQGEVEVALEPSPCPDPPCAELDDAPRPTFTMEALVAEINVPSGRAASTASEDWDEIARRLVKAQGLSASGRLPGYDEDSEEGD